MISGVTDLAGTISLVNKPIIDYDITLINRNYLSFRWQIYNLIH
jgi:hypothetical protein